MSLDDAHLPYLQLIILVIDSVFLNRFPFLTIASDRWRCIACQVISKNVLKPRLIRFIPVTVPSLAKNGIKRYLCTYLHTMVVARKKSQSENGEELQCTYDLGIEYLDMMQEPKLEVELRSESEYGNILGALTNCTYIPGTWYWPQQSAKNTSKQSDHKWARLLGLASVTQGVVLARPRYERAHSRRFWRQKSANSGDVRWPCIMYDRLAAGGLYHIHINSAGPLKIKRFWLFVEHLAYWTAPYHIRLLCSSHNNCKNRFYFCVENKKIILSPSGLATVGYPRLASYIVSARLGEWWTWDPWRSGNNYKRCNWQIAMHRCIAASLCFPKT